MILSSHEPSVRKYLAYRDRPRLDLHIYSDFREASDAVARVSAWLDQQGVVSERAGDISLVLAEALNNVIEHAYGDERSGHIEVKATFRAQTVSVQIVDRGKPFDGPPEEVSLNTTEREIKDLPEGGFGWFLIKSLTEDIHFSHENGMNKLTLVVSLEPGSR